VGAICIHGHFYQPPRDNPWTGTIVEHPGAAPFHDWNARIHAECYAPNVAARTLDEAGQLRGVHNNFSNISFNVGPTLMRWIRAESPSVYRAIVQADLEASQRSGGH
ncbi:uncharacterized protein METZ01_LOCUS341063, partial [marine metagenome]